MINKETNEFLKALELQETRFDTLCGSLNKKALLRVLKGFVHTPVGGRCASPLTREENELVNLGNGILHLKMILAIEQDIKQQTKEEENKNGEEN